MAKSVLTVDVDEFRKAVPGFSTGLLKNILDDIYQVKYDQREKIPMPLVIDLERKETIIQGEFTRRGYLNKKNYAEYRLMREKKFKRKIW